MLDRMIIVNSNCYHGYDVFESIKGIHDAGFHHVELTATKGWTEHVFPDFTFEKLLQVKECLKKYDVDVPSFSGHCNLMDSERLPDFVKNIHLAAFFGAKTIVSSIGEAHLKDKAKLGDEELKKNLLSLIPVLEEEGMNLVLETHGEHGTARRIKEITSVLNTERIKVCYDTANAIFYGDVEGTEDVEAAVDEIRYLHIKDKAAGRHEWNFPALGDGYVDFPAILKVLDDNDNASPLSIEIEFTQEGSSSIEEVNEAVKKSGKYLEDLGYTL